MNPWCLRIAAAAVVLGSLAVAQAPPQTASPTTYDVASIRVNDGPQAIETMSISGTLVTMQGYTVAMLVQEAYGVQGYQVSLGTLPHQNQLNDTYYDLEARAPGKGVLPRDRSRAMLRTLLADRFKLAVHRNTKVMPVYVLALSGKAPKLDADTTTPRCGVYVAVATGGQKYAFKGCGMDTLAQMLSQGIVGRPVLEQTGLTGTYDYTLVAMPNDMNRPGISPFTALKALGLKLEPRSAPIAIVVVDHVEKPTPN